MNNDYVIGIDPGKDGYIVVSKFESDGTGTIVDFMKFPTEFNSKNKDKDLVDSLGRITYFLEKYIINNNVITTNAIAIEHVHAMPKQGVVSMFNFGINFGTYLGILSRYSKLVKHIFTPTPAVWQRAVVIKEDNSNTKIQAFKTIRTKYHYLVDEFIGARGGYIDGKGDAFLLSLYAWKEANNGN